MNHSHSPSSASSTSSTIGIFDSGIGGLGVAREIRSQSPSTAITYFADTAYAPYGPKTEDFIRQRAFDITAKLCAQGCASIVVACNSATSAAIDELRIAFPQIRFVGYEAPIKPAFAASKNGRVGVMATRATLESARFAQLALLAPEGSKLVSRACPHLASAIETGDFRRIDLLAREHARAFELEGCDTVALGCTHYPLARRFLEAAFGPRVGLVSACAAVARQALAASQADKPIKSETKLAASFGASGDLESAFDRAKTWAPHFALSLSPMAWDLGRQDPLLTQQALNQPQA